MTYLFNYIMSLSSTVIDPDRICIKRTPTFRIESYYTHIISPTATLLCTSLSVLYTPNVVVRVASHLFLYTLSDYHRVARIIYAHETQISSALVVLAQERDFPTVS